MDSKFFSKLLDYIETHSSLCSLDFEALGFEKHSDALVSLKSLQSFGSIFVVNDVKKSSWCLTDKGKEFLRNYQTSKSDCENTHNDHKNDTLFKCLSLIERENFKSVEDNLLNENEKEEYIKKSEIDSLEVTKGDSFENKLKLANDLTVDMIPSKWKNVILSNYNYNQLGNMGKSGSLHVVYDFINAARYSLFELGFREVTVPCFVEKSSFEDTVIEILQDDLDSIYNVSLKENNDKGSKENLLLEADFISYYCLRNNLFHGLLSEISALKSVPSKLFTIGKVFQNKNFNNLDIPEFHALEIMVSDSDLDLSNVLGICFGLFSRLNIVYTDFKQAYFPYTSPTVGIYLYNEILDAWISVGEGGIIRPELMKKLGYNENATVLRLGFSLERVLLNKKETDDMNHLLWQKEK